MSPHRCYPCVRYKQSLRERVGERVQAGLPKAPRIQILLLRQRVRLSGIGPETYTLTLSLVSRGRRVLS